MLDPGVTSTHSCIYAYTLAYTLAYICVYMRTYVHANKHACIHTHAHSAYVTHHHPYLRMRMATTGKDRIDWDFLARKTPG